MHFLQVVNNYFCQQRLLLATIKFPRKSDPCCFLCLSYCPYTMFYMPRP